MTARKGVYPSLSMEDIQASLESWNISVTEMQLNRPTPDFVEPIYKAFLLKCADVDMDALQSHLVTSIEDVSGGEDKELYIMPLYRSIFVHHLWALSLVWFLELMHIVSSARLAEAGQINPEVSSVSIHDISAPTKERTHALLSCFINFNKYMEQNVDEFVQELVEKSEQVVKERQATRQRLEEIRGKINLMKCVVPSPTRFLPL
jgi:kinetochore protein Nuf2